MWGHYFDIKFKHYNTTGRIIMQIGNYVYKVKLSVAIYFIEDYESSITEF